MNEFCELISIHPSFSFFYHQVFYVARNQDGEEIATGKIKRNLFQSFVYRQLPCFSKTVCNIEFSKKFNTSQFILSRPFSLVGTRIYIYDSNKNIYGHIKSNVLFTKFSLYYKDNLLLFAEKNMGKKWHFDIITLKKTKCGFVSLRSSDSQNWYNLESCNGYEIGFNKKEIDSLLAVIFAISLHMFHCFPWLLPFCEKKGNI